MRYLLYSTQFDPLPFFSIDHPVKQFFNERFNISEFFTDDVDDNEGELKLLLDHSNSKIQQS